jgi:hypothetical protein
VNCTGTSSHLNGMFTLFLITCTCFKYLKID